MDEIVQLDHSLCSVEHIVEVESATADNFGVEQNMTGQALNLVLVGTATSDPKFEKFDGVKQFLLREGDCVGWDIKLDSQEGADLARCDHVTRGGGWLESQLGNDGQEH